MNLPLNPDQVVYSFDTSSLIKASAVLYPMENFPSLWDKIEELIRNGRLKMSEPVFDEAMRGAVLKNWCSEKGLKPFLLSRVNDSVENAFQTIRSEYPELINVKRGTSLADPWVIALAMQYPNGVVVTEEQRTGNILHPRIPDVCGDLGIEWINIAGLVRRENWVFRAGTER